MVYKVMNVFKKDRRLHHIFEGIMVKRYTISNIILHQD